MHIHNGSIILEGIKGISPGFGDFMQYTDTNYNTITIPTDVVIRLYSVLEYEVERQGLNFSDIVNEILKSVDTRAK